MGWRAVVLMMMAGVVGGLEAFEGSLAKYELSRTGRVRPVVPPGRRRGGARKGLLTAEEEVAIGRKIQELMPLEIAREELCAECGAAISWEEAANRLGLAPAEMLDGMRTLRQMKGVMVEKNMGLVYTMARRYRNFGVSYDDLVQEGALGLMRAAEKFNPELGFRFSTYAVWWIRQRQQTAATKHQMISISTTQRFKYSKILEKIKKYENEYGREPTAAELPGVTGFDAQTIEDLKISTSLRFESFSKKIKFNSAKSDDAFELQDTISCDEALPEDAADALYRRQELDHLLQDKLNMVERDLVRMRLGLDDGRPKELQELAKIFRTSVASMKEMENSAYCKLMGERVAATA